MRLDGANLTRAPIKVSDRHRGSAYLIYQFSLSDPATGDLIRDNQVTLGMTISYPLFF